MFWRAFILFCLLGALSTASAEIIVYPDGSASMDTNVPQPLLAPRSAQAENALTINFNDLGPSQIVAKDRYANQGVLIETGPGSIAAGVVTGSSGTGPCNGTRSIQRNPFTGPSFLFRFPSGASNVTLNAGDFGPSDQDVITITAYGDDALTTVVASSTRTLAAGAPTGCIPLTVAAQRIAAVEVTSTGPFPNSLFVDDLVFNSASPLAFVVGIGSDPLSSLTERKSATGGLETANVPLGAVFFIKLVNDINGTITPVDSSFSLGLSTVTPAISTEPTLFKDNVVILFDTISSSSTFKVFQAVHLGNVVLTITPTNTTISPVKLKIQVNNPASLGTTHTEIDNVLSDLGHRRGIPPHMLKGQVKRESSFSPTAYRYEPLSVDLGWISAGQNLRTTNPYNLYRLATTDGLAQGSDILDEDITPRSIYSIRRDDAIRAIANTDQLVSAHEIYNENDVAHRWSTYSPARARAVQANPEVLKFTAQTPLAASFGYLQILYSTADKPMRWTGNTNGDRNPSFLFDTSDNLQNGGGSLVLGTGYLRGIFSRANPTLDVNIPSFNSATSLEQAFTRDFNYYNHGNPTGEYGTSVITFSRTFTPVPSGAIFQ